MNLQHFRQFKRTILISIGVSALTFGGLVLVLGSYIALNRDSIFSYLAAPMLRGSTTNGLDAAVYNAATGEAVATPENFSRAFGRDEDLVIAAVEKADPAVFSIAVNKDVPVREYYSNDPFYDFFNNPFGFNEDGGSGAPRTESRRIGGGSGFFISKDGLAVTNRHVVADEDASYTAFLNNGEEYPVTVVAKDPVLDIAIVRVQGTAFSHLSFANSDILRLGQTAIAIGNALGEYSNSVSTGVISGVSRSIVAGDTNGRSELLDEVIQTDAAINPGNSGGPLLDLNGNVIGMNVAVAGMAENIGFAIPSNLIKTVVDSINENGAIIRPYLGVRFVPVTPLLQRQSNLPIDYGVLIHAGTAIGEPAILPGSPAAKAGLRENDIILEVDGKRLTEKTSLATIIRRKAVGDRLPVRLLRNGKEMQFTITLEQMPT